MEEKWKFFEYLDEFVYVTNMDTDELIYMNAHLRKALDIPDDQTYQGKKCYAVLQHNTAKCPFCNNEKLRQGYFESWIHHNPVLNKRFLIKDTMLEHNGQRYRLEIAIDTSSDVVSQTPHHYARVENLLSQCLQFIFSTTRSEESITRLLSFFGETFSCDRAYIFELDGDYVHNTYEWCADGIIPQKEILSTLHISAVDWWFEMFRDSSTMVLPDIEELRTTYPTTYAVLKPQGITSLAVGVIQDESGEIGFFGVDNPDPAMVSVITSLIRLIGYFISVLLKRRDLFIKLNQLSYHDPLTGALNRHALEGYYKPSDLSSLGVIYCDITGLKQVNDKKGHEAGDQMIRHCYQLIADNLETDQIFRVGGDEFVVLCLDWPNDRFMRSALWLKQAVKKDEYHMAVGYAWSDQSPLDLESLMQIADRVMYEDKQDYYQQHPTEARRTPLSHLSIQVDETLCNGQQDSTQSMLREFLDTSYHDMHTVVRAMTEDNSSSYFYMGDIKKDLFYISDNMRDDFGFESNLVPDLLHNWASRITEKEYRDLFLNDIASMVQERRPIHDTIYRIKDVYGNHLLVRCFAVMSWEVERRKPSFIVGRITHQDTNLVVDPITGFPREHAAVQHIQEIANRRQQTLIIGFSVNGFTELNRTRGRAYSDHLLKQFANTLLERFSWKMSFFRLDGIRFMAVLKPHCYGELPASLVEQIRDVAAECFADIGIQKEYLCSCATIDYPVDGLDTGNLIVSLSDLIRVGKQSTGQAYVAYMPQHLERLQYTANMTLALGRDVRNDMANFRIVVQPVVSAQDGSVVGGEVLLRWRYHDMDISPAVFIPLLEQSTLICNVGRWVFEETVRTCVRLRSFYPDLYLSFNVSLQQLTDVQLIPFMESMLKKYYLPSDAVVAELTESCLDEQSDELRTYCKECQRLGIRTALDDFGSGYSSLRMLLQYPFGIIKMDRSLIVEATESQERNELIYHMVCAFRQFGKTICIEGVESSQENELAIQAACHTIQGYYYHEPMELNDVFELFSQSM